jgi:hypothetical protein
MKVVDDLLEDGMDYKKAVKVAIRKYKHMLENYLDEVIDNENSFTYLSTFDSHLSSFASLASVANFVKAISSPSSIIVCSSKRAFLDSL